MTHTLNPVITVTVSGPVGSGKSYVLARIEEMVETASLSMLLTWRMSAV
ncbi:hypothetical protein [Escherichia coli]|nr:hypothetical protein [Escherichia coli]